MPILYSVSRIVASRVWISRVYWNFSESGTRLRSVSRSFICCLYVSTAFFSPSISSFSCSIVRVKASLSYVNRISPATTSCPTSTWISETVMDWSTCISSVLPATTRPAYLSARPTLPIPVIIETDCTETAFSLLSPQPAMQSKSAAASTDAITRNIFLFIFILPLERFRTSL